MTTLSLKCSKYKQIVIFVQTIHISFYYIFDMQATSYIFLVICEYKYLKQYNSFIFEMCIIFKLQLLVHVLQRIRERHEDTDHLIHILPTSHIEAFINVWYHQIFNKMLDLLIQVVETEIIQLQMNSVVKTDQTAMVYFFTSNSFEIF